MFQFNHHCCMQTQLLLPVHKIIKTALRTPAWPTIHPDLKKTITPKILIRQDVKTPSHVPNNTG